MRLTIEMTWPVDATLFPRLTQKEREALWDGRRELAAEHAECEADRIHVVGLLGCGNRVPDKERFRIHCGVCQCDGQRPERGERHLMVVPVDEPVLLILLESPHMDEYECSVANPVEPARGKTGANLRDKLRRLLESSELAEEVWCGSRVAIAIPVQFQASLHAVHRKTLQSRVYRRLRDRVWESNWSLPEVREDFGDRIRQFGPTWIINACTGGANGWGSVNGAVSEWLVEGDFGCSLYATTHPAHWHWQPPELSRLAKVNLNHASRGKMQEVLISLGGTTFGRLVEGRPYESLEDVERRVRGINRSVLEGNARKICLE